jgi:predicted nucleic acid-binding protein
MSDNAFIDSNIIVCAYDSHEPAKQTKAQALLTSAIKEASAVLSVQVLGEFFAVVTRRIKNPLSVNEAEKIVNILATLPVYEIDLSLVRRAIETQKEYRISYWDSLIIMHACGDIDHGDAGAGAHAFAICLRK